MEAQELQELSRQLQDSNPRPKLTRFTARRRRDFIIVTYLMIFHTKHPYSVHV